MVEIPPARRRLEGFTSAGVHQPDPRVSTASSDTAVGIVPAVPAHAQSRSPHGGYPQGKKVIVTAQALEQGVLESKDKSQLIQIAEALGVKANARLKKADIIDQILAKTGGGQAVSAPASAPVAAAAPAPAPVEEPKAEWEQAPVFDQDHLQAIGENVFIVGDHGQRNRRLGHGGGG